MYVVVDTHTGLTVSNKFARRARAAAIAATKNKKTDIRNPGSYDRYEVKFLGLVTPK